MALDAIIFDVDGTLIDSNQLHVEAFRRVFAEAGFDIRPDRIAVEIGKGGDLLVPAIVGKEADEQSGDRIRQRQPEVFAELAKQQGLPLIAGARELLAETRSAGLKIVIATSSGKKQVKTLSEVSGLDLAREADVMVTSDDAATSKPAPDLLASAVKKSGLSPALCMMIGDTPYDASSAKLAGVITLGVRSSGVGVEDSALYAAGARALYDNALDIRNHFADAVRTASPAMLHLTYDRMNELMERALAAARDGMAEGEVPIGAVLARGDGVVIGRGWNRYQHTGNRAAHAEMETFANASGKIGEDQRDLILVSTLEPCVMCTGAAMESAVDTVIFGMRAPLDAGTDRVRPPRSPESQMPRIIGDIRADESRALLAQWLKQNPNKKQAEYVAALLGESK